jgi:hypothetical protein
MNYVAPRIKEVVLKPVILCQLRLISCDDTYLWLSHQRFFFLIKQRRNKSSKQFHFLRQQKAQKRFQPNYFIFRLTQMTFQKYPLKCSICLFLLAREFYNP